MARRDGHAAAQGTAARLQQRHAGDAGAGVCGDEHGAPDDSSAGEVYRRAEVPHRPDARCLRERISERDGRSDVSCT